MPTKKLSECLMKQPNGKLRNAYAISAKRRRAGKIRSKSEKRQNGKNKQALYLSQND